MNLLEACARELQSPVPSSKAEPVLSRRKWLTGGALLGTLFGTDADAQEVKPRPPRSQGEDDGDASIRGGSPFRNLLVRRATMGLTQEELGLFAASTPEGYVNRHLNYLGIDDSACDERLVPYQRTLDSDPYELLDLDSFQIARILIYATILRSIYSKRQLFERTVTFWTDHLNIDILKDYVSYMKIADDREVIRRHALGKFPDMMQASAKSAAMLFYLDNYVSRVGFTNQNYARELLELHTLGVDNGYTQRDIEEVTKCFTGWTINYNQGNNFLKFLYYAPWHDQSEKQVLGYRIPAGGGRRDGEIVIDILTRDARIAPLTAGFISQKMCRWFWGYEPPVSLVEAVKETYLGTDGDIKAMVRTILSRANLATATPKYKRPYETIISCLRATHGSVGTPLNVLNALDAAGHVPYYWGPPDGYPDRLDFWAGLILPRWNFAFSYLNGDLPGVTFDLDAFLAGSRRRGPVLQRINTLLFGGELTGTDYQTLYDYLAIEYPTTDGIRDAIALALSSPSFQWY